MILRLVCHITLSLFVYFKTNVNSYYTYTHDAVTSSTYTLTEPKIRGGIADNSIIFFLVSQRKHML